MGLCMRNHVSGGTWFVDVLGVHTYSLRPGFIIVHLSFLWFFLDSTPPFILTQGLVIAQTNLELKSPCVNLPHVGVTRVSMPSLCTYSMAVPNRWKLVCAAVTSLCVSLSRIPVWGGVSRDM